MYSKVKIAGHPVHPMLVAFPIAFYVSSLVCYIVYSSTANVFWFRVAYVANVAAVVMALVAAIPGLIDWAVGIPKNSVAKKTGLLHAVANIVALVLFAVNAWVMSGQWNAVAPKATNAILLTALGVLCVLVAGFFGWSLVQTYHVGVQLTPDQAKYEDELQQTPISKTLKPSRGTTV